MKKLELLFFFLHGMSGLKNINHSPEGDGCKGCTKCVQGGSGCRNSHL